MMRLSRKGMLAAGILAAVSTAALSAGIWSTLPIVGSGQFCTGILGTGNAQNGITGTGAGTTIGGQVICSLFAPAGPPGVTSTMLIPADNPQAGGAPPTSVTIPATLLMPSFSNPRNLLDNGAMAIQQRGTGTVTCGTNTAPTLTAYSADRWVCDVNVASGAGRTALSTTTPVPPAGFPASLTLFRTSGALTQPVCAMQEVPTIESTAVAGLPVTLSFYAAALAGLSADNGNIINAYLITGTGTDQGFGTLTASPAITPAWTGITSNLTAQFTISTTYTRYQATFTPPATATELGVVLCFTPTATGSGATDGFAFAGVQLEQNVAATQFEFRQKAQELAKAQAFYQRFAELAATYPVNGFCQAITANTNTCTLGLSQQMRSTPTITITTAGTFKVNIAGTLTTIATPTAGNCGLNACIVTAANTNTAGQVEQLTGAAGGSGVWEVSADF